MRYRGQLLATTLCAVMMSLAGCGGSGVNSTPPPTPAPSPSPSPSPTPTPVATQEPPAPLPETTTGTLAQAYQTSQDFRTGSTELLYDVDAGTVQTRNKGYESSTSIRIQYDKATDTYIVFNLDIGTAYRWPQGTETADTLYREFGINGADGGRQLRILKSDDPSIALSYTSMGEWQFDSSDRPDVTPQVDDRHYFYFGIPTADADVPHTGSAQYSGIATGVLYDPSYVYDLNGTATLGADFATGSITTTLDVQGQAFGGPSITLPELTGAAAIASGANGFLGTLSTTDDSFTGSFRGAFFGPHAEEFGYSWAINSPDLTRLGGGAAVGKR